MSRYAECLAHVLKFEGGFVDDPDDRGGATNQGITQATFDAWQDNRELPRRAVRDITDYEVEAIYHVRYWSPCRGDDLHPPLDLVVFDAAVQHGPHRAIKWLQELVGVQVDGTSGEKTLYAVNGHVLSNGVTDLVDAYMTHRASFYASIIARDPSQKKFQKGWANRMNAVQDLIARGLPA